MIKVTAISALSTNNVIGVDNDLPWHIPSDLKHFKRTTLGKPIIYGKNTWNSLPGALPGRLNIILSTSLSKNEFSPDQNVKVANSIDEVFGMCANEDQIYICGGQQVYAAFLPYLDGMILTHVDTIISEDKNIKKFPIDYNTPYWEKVSISESVYDKYTYQIATYHRKLRNR